MLQALGFTVRGWHRDGTTLTDVLAGAQVVVNTLPLTPQTANLLDARAFAALPRGAYLVNVARGGHVVEADLIAAVQSGQLSGAALDVQLNEPLPADDPLWAVPGITITPHIAAQPDTRHRGGPVPGQPASPAGRAAAVERSGPATRVLSVWPRAVTCSPSNGYGFATVFGLSCGLSSSTGPCHAALLLPHLALCPQVSGRGA